MALVYLGVGSNLGDRQENIRKALIFLKENEAIDVLQCSKIIETVPEGVPPQGDFLNGVIEIETQLMPLELLSALKNIERRLGRSKKIGSSDPRTIDLDILFYNDVVIVNGKNLTIPHPRAAKRQFVLEPLAEIAPDYKHPVLKKAISEIYGDFQNENISKNLTA